MKLMMLSISLYFLVGCATPVANKNTVGQKFPIVKANYLSGESVTLPNVGAIEREVERVIILVGYVQKSQFDVDRWTIGLTETNVTLPIVEIAVINQWLPEVFAKKLDQSMRDGIPKNLWKSVITVYDEAQKVRDFLGTTNPLNARAVVIDSDGTVLFQHDTGFSAEALKKMLKFVPRGNKSKKW